MAEPAGSPRSPQVQVPQVPLSQRLYVRIYLALLLSLALAGALFTAAARLNNDAAQVGTSLETFAEFAAEILPPASDPDTAQQAALAHWQPRIRTDLALYAANGRPIAAAGRVLPPLDPHQSASGWIGGAPPVFALKLPDGRWLVGQRIHNHAEHRPRISSAGALVLIALAIAIGAYPVVRRLTRRLEGLQASVEALGAGRLSTRVAVQGEDEVARLAHSFNRSAERIEALVGAQKTLLANASHELRSPLARIRMAIELLDTAPQAEMQEELTRNVLELDQLIDEILLASRLDASVNTPLASAPVELSALLREEAQRVGASVEAAPLTYSGDAVLLRRMVRNLLENARRHGGGGAIEVRLCAGALEHHDHDHDRHDRHDQDDRCEQREQGGQRAQRDGTNQPDTIAIEVCDAGPGVAASERENIFMPFYRQPGVRERDGSIGLGLSLVRQIARRHGGEVSCTAREGGGSCFTVRLPKG